MNISQQTLDILKAQGYTSLKDYFDCLAEDYEIVYNDVVLIAELYGEQELFDGLPSALDCI